MNSKQKIIVQITSVIILAMLLFPPFHILLREGVTINSGYNFILSPPSQGKVFALVNIWQLFVQWIGVCLMSGLMLVSFQDK